MSQKHVCPCKALEISMPQTTGSSSKNEMYIMDFPTAHRLRHKKTTAAQVTTRTQYDSVRFLIVFHSVPILFLYFFHAPKTQAALSGRLQRAELRPVQARSYEATGQTCPMKSMGRLGCLGLAASRWEMHLSSK